MKGETMKASRDLAALIAAILILPTQVRAAELGDPAPELKVAEWLKGDPVVLADGKGQNIYVIEIWATTCLETLKAFIEEMGSKMEYRVAMDQDETTAKAYMLGFRISTIPYAFLIDKSGNVVWHGHPLLGLEKALDALLAGTYDIEARRRIEEARRLMPRYIHMLRSASQADKAAELGEQILTDGQDDAMLMKELAWTVVAGPGLVNRDLELAMRAAQTAYDACEGQDAGIVATYARVLFENGKKKEAIEYQQKAVQLAEGLEFQKELQEALDMYMSMPGD